jgi:hypothetical protein
MRVQGTIIMVKFAIFNILFEEGDINLVIDTNVEGSRCLLTFTENSLILFLALFRRPDWLRMKTGFPLLCGLEKPGLPAISPGFRCGHDFT